MRDEILSQLFPDPQTPVRSSVLGGGCISDVRLVDFDDGARQVVKVNTISMHGNFSAEFEGLTALRDAVSEVSGLVVPEARKPMVIGEQVFLTMEYLERSGPVDEIEFAQSIGQLQLATRGRDCGWVEDNFLGAAPQRNSMTDDWVDFFADRRLGFQLRWAVDQKLASEELAQEVEMVRRNLGGLLDGRPGWTCLLHGDLWSGNFFRVPSEHGEVRHAIIDPAVYRGCPEAELGMLRLFGNVSQGFYEAYDATIPSDRGRSRRIEVYRLYHLLNHLNLFGTGYLGDCSRCARDLLRS